MIEKNRDGQGRWRNKTVSFRVSPEEDKLLEDLVYLSGLSKQEYIMRRLAQQEIVVIGNTRVYKALRNELAEVLKELKRLKTGDEISEELLKVIEQITITMKGMKEQNKKSL